MPESVKRRGSSGPTIGATVRRSSRKCSDLSSVIAEKGSYEAVILRAVPTCLVTGGAGFLGSHLCDELLARGHRVICIDNLETGSLANIAHIRSDKFVHRGIDIIEPYYVDEPIDFVYHLASPASPIDYLRLPLHTLEVCSYGTCHQPCAPEVK